MAKKIYSYCVICTVCQWKHDADTSRQALALKRRHRQEAGHVTRDRRVLIVKRIQRVED